eukprot:COSAG02_NODE_14670_length_1249_cov_2.033043_1_plen_163_part_00
MLWDYNVLPGRTSRQDILLALAASDYNLFWCTDPSVDVRSNSSLFPLGGNRGLEGWQLASKFDINSIVAGAQVILYMETLQGSHNYVLWVNYFGVIVIQHFSRVLETLLMGVMQIHFLLRLIVAITRYKTAAQHSASFTFSLSVQLTLWCHMWRTLVLVDGS